MPTKLYPILLAVAYLLTLFASGHKEGFLIETLFHRNSSNGFAWINFQHTLFFMCIDACLVQRQPLLYCFYFLLAFGVGHWNAYSLGDYIVVTMISQIPFLLIGFRGL